MTVKETEEEREASTYSSTARDKEGLVKTEWQGEKKKGKKRGKEKKRWTAMGRGGGSILSRS
jgi:hypothetical protein